MVADDFADLGGIAGVDADSDGFNDGDADADGLLDVGETWLYTGSHAVTQDDIDNNGNFDSDDPADGINDVLRNVATVNADAVTTGETVSDDDDATVDVCQNPAIDIEKYVMTDVSGAFVDADDPDGPAASTSTTVDFKVVLTNTGNVTLENITLSDSVVHTVGGVAQSPVAIDYSDPALGAFIDLDGDATLDSGEEWANFDTNGDGTLDVDENGDPFQLSVGESVSIYYSLTSALGQHENTAVVTADATTSGDSTGDNDDANYFVLGSDDCVGVRTPGFWANTKWMTFWDGQGDGWNTAPNEPKQAGTPGFADGELLYGVDSNHDGFVNHVAGDGSNDDKPLDAKGLLIGDYNMNGITDAGEDTIFIGYNDALKLINASSKQLAEGKGTADGIYMLGRDMVATWLNYLANNQGDGDNGNCIGTVDGATNSPREFLDAAIDWMQQFASTSNADDTASHTDSNTNTSFHDGNTQATFEFDSRINPSSASWQTAFTAGEDIPVSAARHAFGARCLQQHRGDQRDRILLRRRQRNRVAGDRADHLSCGAGIPLAPEREKAARRGPRVGPLFRGGLSVSVAAGLPAEALAKAGGEGGIRTHGTVARTPHFECGAFDHSATSPLESARRRRLPAPGRDAGP